MTIFVEDKLKPGLVGQRLADASDIAATGDTTVQAEIDAIKAIDGMNPVSVGQSFRFSDGNLNYDGTVFLVHQHTQVITFSDNDVDIPGLPSGVFHTTGAYFVIQYDEGLVFVRVRSSTSSGDEGDVEANVVQSISFTNGDSFTVPNVVSNARIGVMRSVEDPETDVSFELVRASTGQTLGSDFTHPALNNVREFTYTLSNEDEANIALGLLAPNKHALGPVGSGASDAAVITNVTKNPSNPRQVIVDLSSPVTAGANQLLRIYEVTSEIVRHVIVESGANAELSNNTLRLTSATGGGGNGIQYTSPTPANNELIAATGNPNEAKASGITLNAEGNIPMSHVGSGDLEVTGTGGSLTISPDNIDQYRDRTLLINHTNTFTINMRAPSEFRADGVPRFTIRVVNLTNNNVSVQSTVSATIGGRTRQRLERDNTILFELPTVGQDFPVLSETFGDLTSRLIRGYQLVTANIAADSSLNAHHFRKIEDAARRVRIADGLRSGSYFYFQNVGLNDITVDTEGSETIEGADSFAVSRGELWLMTKDNSGVWRAFLINKEYLIQNNQPRYDSLASGKSDQPTNATDESFTLMSTWNGNRVLKLTINGITISGFSPTMSGNDLAILSYAITAPEWASIYAASSSQLTYSIQDNSTDEIIYGNIARA